MKMEELEELNSEPADKKYLKLDEVKEAKEFLPRKDIAESSFQQYQGTNCFQWQYKEPPVHIGFQ